MEMTDRICDLIEREYGKTSATRGLTNNSDHESFAYIEEAAQAASENMNHVLSTLNELWQSIRHSDSTDIKLAECQSLYNDIILAVSDVIDLGVEAKRALVTICDRAAKEEIKIKGDNVVTFKKE